MGRSGSMVARGIRVLVVDEHAGVRQAIATFLTAVDELELAAQAASGKEAIRLCARTQPDVVLMDVALPDMTSAAATRALLQRCPDVRVIAMYTFQHEGLVPQALQSGAVGCLLKNVSADELARAILAAHAAQAPGAHQPSDDHMQVIEGKEAGNERE